nr:SpoIIE family protein phosphatase [Allorhizocola rhizosphaerae]
MEQALLLTAELSTNVVRHTGSNLDLEVATDWRGVTVTVGDHSPGGLNPAPPDEGGYGLVLVDRFSHSWGVHHHANGKAVWFRLETQDSPGTPPLTPDSALAAVEALLNVDPEADLDETAAEYAHRMLERLAEWLPAESGAVLLDTGDGPTTLASFGPPIDEWEWDAALPLTRPWSGSLVLGVPQSAHAMVLTRLAAERLGLALERQRLKHTDDQRRTWLTFVAEASELLAQSLDPALTTALIPRLVVPRLGSWCAVYTVDDPSSPQLATAAHSDEAELPSLLSTLEEQLKHLDVTDWLTPLAPPTEGYLIPLAARGQRLGLLAVGRHEDHRHHPDELEVLSDLARRAALAIDNARIHHERRRIAHALQQSLLPPELPQVDGLELGAQYVPIGDDVDVGGDFYDAVPMSDGRWLLVVGDVSGKGIQAANVTGLVRDVIRVLVRDGRPLESILDTLNEMLYERGGRYCTLALAVVAPCPDGTARLTLHLAGHDQPILINDSGAVTEVGAGGTAVGLLKELSSPRTSLVLRPGESIVFYTDGVTERRRHDEFFGIARLKRVLKTLSGYPAEVIAARLGSTVLGFSNEPPRDDIAILVLRNTL